MSCGLRTLLTVSDRPHAIELGLWAEIQWHAFMHVTSACCIVQATGGGVVFDPLSLALVVCFFPRAVVHIVNACTVLVLW